MFTPGQQYAIGALFALLGTFYQFAHNRTDTKQGYSIPTRLFSAVCGFALTVLLQYYPLFEWHWHFVIVSAAGFGLGLGIERFIRLFMLKQNSAESTEEFIEVWKKAGKGEGSGPARPPADPPTNDQQP